MDQWQMTDELDEISHAFANALFERFPEWKCFARVVAQGKVEGYLELEVPQASTERALALRTSDNEITMGFDRWYTHVGPFMGVDIDESVAQAIVVIEDFIAERTIVKVTSREGAWRMS